jgi:WD40 repeat protein
VQLFDVATAEKQKSHGLHTGKLHSLAISPEGKTLASGGGDRTVILWNVLRQEPRLALDGNLAVTASKDGTVKLWNLSQDAAGAR